jgi:hypothetical protein
VSGHETLLRVAERAALDDLVPLDQQTGRIVDDLAAVQEGVILDALHRELRSQRDADAQRWAGVSLPLLPP